jgi:DNA-directed RNA polymerase specialized sigma24 family protein
VERLQPCREDAPRQPRDQSRQEGPVKTGEERDVHVSAELAAMALVGVLDEVERAWIVERTHAGLRRARAQGKRLGRPRTVTDTHRLRRMLADGASYREAARTLKVSEGTVRRAVRDDPAFRHSRQQGRPSSRGGDADLPLCHTSGLSTPQHVMLW